MADQTSPKAKSQTLVVVVRIGTFYDDKGKQLHKFRYVTDDASMDRLGEDLVFLLTKDTRHIDGVGTVWEMNEYDYGDKRQWGVSRAKYLRMWENETKRLEWSAAQEVRDMEHDAELRAKVAGEDSPLNDMLAKLRGLYHKQIGNNRSKFLAYVVKEIVK